MMRCKIFIGLLFFSCGAIAQEKLIYHDIKTNKSGNIISWFNADPGTSYDHVINLVWNFWDTMRTDINGIPYYMNHQVWKEGTNDPRGLGGDQFSMALSSWRLLYAYSGNERVKENMKYIADYYLTNGLSARDAAWPLIPYPYNTLIYSGTYDGDMIIGKYYTQPDKAGAFGWELVNLYKLLSAEVYPNVTQNIYLDAAIEIANTLARHTQTGDEHHSPLPFKVNAVTGETGVLKNNNRDGSTTDSSSYTSNWVGTMELFLALQELKAGDVALYRSAFDKLLSWMKKYPLQNHRWGPFFEDIPGWSDTQINAITFAMFIMNHQQYFPAWKEEVKKIFGWVDEKLSNTTWKKYGVTVVNEQTAYQVPGNSHTSRQASIQLQYISLTGDSARYTNSVRQLSWATYMVDNDGKNRYPQDANWLTDGYGDYVRHFLRAMGSAPQLSPNADHLLYTSSVVQQVFYKNQMDKLYYPLLNGHKNVVLLYTVFDKSGNELIRLTKKPGTVLFDTVAAKENTTDGYEWKPLSRGGVLLVHRKNAGTVIIKE